MLRDVLSIPPHIVLILLPDFIEMKPSLLISAMLFAIVRASDLKSPLTASTIASLADQAELMLPEIDKAPETGYMELSFEEVIANVILRFSALYYGAIELRGMTVAEKLDRLLPGQGYNLKTDDEAAEDAKESDTMADRDVMEELKKRQVSLISLEDFVLRDRELAYGVS